MRFMIVPLALGILLVAVVVAYAAFQRQAPVSYEWTDAFVEDLVLENSSLAMGQSEGPSVVGTIDMRNTGNQPLTGITVSIPILDAPQTFTATCPGGCGSLAVDETKTITVTVFRNGAGAGVKLTQLVVDIP